MGGAGDCQRLSEIPPGAKLGAWDGLDLEWKRVRGWWASLGTRELGFGPSEF